MVMMACLLLPTFAVGRESDSEIACKEASQGEGFINYICEGTIWEVCYDDPRHDTETNTLVIDKRNMRNWLEGCYEIDGKTYMAFMVAYDKDNYETAYRRAYIRYDKGKVYRKYESKPEELLYDYTLNIGEYCMKIIDDVYRDIKAECTGFREISNSGINYQVMDMSLTSSPYIDPEAGISASDLGPEFDYNEKTWWIKGLGGPNGILMYCAPFISELTAIYHNGTLIYKRTTAGIDNSVISSPEAPAQAQGFHLDGTPFKEGDQGICIINGKKVIR